MMAVELLRLTLVLAATSLSPSTPILRDDVDAIELNHVYDESGRHVLSQLIFWKQHGPSRDMHVVAWRIWKPGFPTPMRDVQQGDYVLLFYDRENLRIVRAQTFRESWTQYDPEIADRLWLPQEQRLQLTRRERPASEGATTTGH